LLFRTCWQSPHFLFWAFPFKASANRRGCPGDAFCLPSECPAKAQTFWTINSFYSSREFRFFYCGLVTLGRAEGGINEWLLTSRYVTNSLCIPLALVGFSSTIAIFSQRQDRSVEIDLLLFNIPLFLVLALSVASEVRAIDWARGESSMRRFTASL
jgi:hypothetical protein